MAEKRKKTSRTASGKSKVVRSTSAKAAASKSTKKKKSAVKKTMAAGPARRAAKKSTPATAAASPAGRAVKAASNNVLKIVESALDDLKAVNVRILDVRKLTDVADTMVIASGNSDRHVRSIADRVIADAKQAGFRPAGIEGQRDAEWVLVDLHDVIVHIMLPRIREFYRLENLWDVSAARREAAELAAGR